MRKTLLLLLTLLSSGCSTVETQTKIVYAHPEIPNAILMPCDQIPNETFVTNGELLMAYLTLQSMYVICSSKVTAIANILDSYAAIYTTKKER